MSKKPNFQNQIRRMLNEKFRERGWHQKSEIEYVLPVNTEAWLYSALNDTFFRYDRSLTLLPTLSVQNHKIEEVMERINLEVVQRLGFAFRITVEDSSSIGMPLAEIAQGKRYGQIIFREAEDISTISHRVDDLVNTVDKFGRKFFESHSTLSDILNSLIPLGPKHKTRWYRVPIALKLLGREKEAQHFLRQQLVSLQRDEKDSFDRYSVFAEVLTTLVA